MDPSPYRVAERFAPVALDDVLAAADLPERVDVKYLIPARRLADLAEHLSETHRVLEIDGRRAFGYRSTYFDTAGLAAYRDHVQRRRRRFKCRSREYVDSGLCTFEVKLKGRRGRTVKHRMAYDPAGRAMLSAAAREFVGDCVERAYGRRPDGDLRPTLVVSYTRVTLVSPERGERLTCDFDLAFAAPDGASGRLAEEIVIVESKSERGGALADRVLRMLGARPEPVCSKYCLGVGLTRPHVRANALRPLLRRHFLAVPAVAALLLAPGAAPAEAKLPKLDIRTSEKIRDDPKVDARMTLNGKRRFRLGIELRGNSSQAFAKKPYAIELEKDAKLAGLPEQDDFDLNAFHTDPTLMRDVLAHSTARRMGLAASRTQYVELRVKRRYQGVYVLMQQPEQTDAEAMLELTEADKVGDGDETFASATGAPVAYVDPDEADKKDARAARAALEAFEAALARGDGSWRDYLDERSAVDAVLHAELFKNQDAFLSSTYVVLRDEGKLAFGPVWDYDLSAGNTVDPGLSSPEGSIVAGRQWSGPLLADPAFQAAVRSRWQALRAAGLLEGMLAGIDRTERRLRGPAKRNFRRWPILDGPLFRNQAVHGSHAASVDALKGWLAARAVWMDGTYGA